MKKQLVWSKRKIILLILIISILFVALVGRLFVLQMINGEYFSSKALKQQLSVSSISPMRGKIYDRNMVTLAESAKAWDVVASPKYIKKDVLRNELADGLSTILGLDRTTIYNNLKKNSSYVVIAKKIDKPTADKVEALIKTSKTNSLSLQDDSKRYYPFGNFASQLIGFTGTDNQGLTGLEGEYNSFLTGVPGRMLTAKNADGDTIPYSNADYVAPQNGGNLVLTIDEVVQHSLEVNLSKAIKDNNVTNRATGIVMNVNTGEILGMATEPSYDPNNPFTISDPALQATLSGLSGDALKQATNNALQTQWRNKAISEPYEPGSVYKVITAAAALEENQVHENDTFPDPGVIQIDDRPFHDWDSANHGYVTFANAYENSWNVVFVQVAETLGAMKFFNFFSGFGFTQKTGIDLPGEANSIYVPENQLTRVALGSCSFGQSNKVTPIQIITAVAASANGGYLVQPHVVKEETDGNGNIVKSSDTQIKRQVISEETSKEIDRLMQMEVDEGSGKNAYVAGYRIGGKTGTAQKLGTTGSVASFIGIAPCDDPQIAVLIILDDPHNPISNYGSTIAAPVAGTVFSEILPDLDVVPKYSDAELQSLAVEAPNVIGMSVSDAKNKISAAGLHASVQGSGDTVTAQSPPAEGMLQKNGVVVLYTGNAQPSQSVSVPNLIGCTPDQVSSKLSSLNLNVKFIGVGQQVSGTVTAYEQDVPYQTKVAPGSVITVKFRDTNLATD